MEGASADVRRATRIGVKPLMSHRLELAGELGQDRIFARLGEDDLVRGQRVEHVGRRDAANGIAGVVDDVVAGDDVDVEDVELHILADAPEVDLGDLSFDLDDLPWNAETHGCTSVPPSCAGRNQRRMTRHTSGCDGGHSTVLSPAS